MSRTSATPTRPRRDVATTGLAVVVLVPGFAFSFLLSWSIGAARSDELLLAASVSLTLANVVGNAIEANSVSEIGRLIGRGTPPGARALRHYVRRILLFGVITCVGVGVPLIVVYGARRPDPMAFAAIAGVMLVMAVVGGVASTFSGLLIAYGRVGLPIGLQALRTLIPTALVLLWPAAPLVVLALGFVTGEVIRLVCLVVASRSVRVPASASEPVADASADLPTRGLVWQSASALTAQSGPVTDRLFLAGAPVGSLSSYEMADKLFFAAAQTVNLGLLVRRLSRWARLRSVDTETGRLTLRRDLRTLLGATAALAILGATACLVGRTLGWVPDAWTQGLGWAAILFVSLPASVAIACGGRLLIIARRQRLLMWFATITAVLNAGLDWVFFMAWGPVGVPIATVVARYVSAALYLVVVSRVLSSVIGSDLSSADSPTPADLLQETR